MINYDCKKKAWEKSILTRTSLRESPECQDYILKYLQEQGGPEEGRRWGVG